MWHNCFICSTDLFYLLNGPGATWRQSLASVQTCKQMKYGEVCAVSALNIRGKNKEKQNNKFAFRDMAQKRCQSP